MDAVRMMRVTKSFGDYRAVDGLSLTVPAGGIYGLIGPNGSGKTTTLRMVMNLILPDEGVIEVLGLRGASAARDRVSYLPEERGLYKKMTVRQVLRYFGLLKGAALSRLDEQLPLWLERLGLQAWADKKVESLSKGMSQKVQFIAALISGPELVILDEPFSGLDPASVHEMKEIIRELSARGRTIIFSTHQMASAEELCDRIGMIFQGRLVLDGTLAQFQRAQPSGSVRVRTDKGLRFLRGMKGVLSATQEDRHQVLVLKGDPQRFLGLLAKQARVQFFEVRRASLNEIFLKLVQAPEGRHVPV
jgi:ABC-2 type transport system ATP-binding protein